jgi:hypothetical protein
VNAGFLDVFHDPADVQTGAVVQSIHVDLDGVFEEAVDEERSVWPDDRLVGDTNKVVANRSRVVDDFHPTTSEDIGRTNEDGVSNFFGDGDRRIDVCRGAVARSDQFVLLEDFGESATFFRDVNRVRRCTEDGDAVLFESVSETERRLPTELNNGADDFAARRFCFDDLEYVLESQRFEVETI